MIKKICVMAAVAMLPTLANAEWNKDWLTRNKVVVDAQAAGAAVADVPVAVRLHSGNFSFIDANPDGADLRFVAADDKTELKYHFEKFDSVNELAVVWVKLPKADPKEKDAHFWIYSGKENAPVAADAKGSFDTATVADFHFAEKTLLQDSVGGLNATGEVTVQKAALLGEAAIFSGKPMTIPAVKLGGAGFTWSAWVKPAAAQQAVLFSQGETSIRIDGSKLALAVGKTAVSGGEIKAAAWQHLAVAVESGKATLYVNGAAVANGDAPMAETQAEVKVGEGYTGELDELQLANVARSADWIKLVAGGQSAEGKLVTVQAAEEGEGGEEEGGASYIGILLDNLTIDAKVVIAILAVMFAISAAVMVGKGLFISRTSKGNNNFLGRFRDARDDFLLLDKNPAGFDNSSIYRLYLAGLREIRKREVAGQPLALTGASLDAIKAAVDADMVRENHRTNSQMVLLTIAISGGPFLGLLGTVVGVMITFAAIAAAGDVNINAIAPGIAAALLATVAGLGVAIPALFGYNYLASRIKNMTADMQIFVDEFITRVAEVHGK